MKMSLLVRGLSASSLILCCWSGSALANGIACSSKTNGALTMTEMQALAKFSKLEAQKIALDAVGTKKVKKIESSELEIEESCLIYSFDIKLKEARGVTEVMVDALTGKVISQKKESTQQEAAENAADSKK